MKNEKVSRVFHVFPQYFFISTVFAFRTSHIARFLSVIGKFTKCREIFRDLSSRHMAGYILYMKHETERKREKCIDCVLINFS